MKRYHSDPEFKDRVLSNSHNRKARKLGLGSAAVTLGYLMKRDGQRCGICRKLIRAKTGPMRASIDHIVPLSRGGTHELANIQVAHYRCNLRKHNGGGDEQLLLFG
jgi:5-methylcytosine-specific restriction endonuclease McrA